MKIVMFYHSLVSDWNHGNAHFLRGVALELMYRGHEVFIYEPCDGWSRNNLVVDKGTAALLDFRQHYPGLSSTLYNPQTLELNTVLKRADLVLVHEWNDHGLVARVGKHHFVHSNYILLFHDTHHRSVTAPDQMAQYDLRYYDGVLAFGACIAEIYRRNRWANRAWVWHEAADTNIFKPYPGVPKTGDLVWIGNWGDDERTAELNEFLLEPVNSLAIKCLVHGVRYPQQAVNNLSEAGISYGGYLANFLVPEVFASHKLTVHVPRRPYTRALPGIPTIRVFEALACGIPLISAPWNDCENLFTGTEFLVAKNGNEMKEYMKLLITDFAFASKLAVNGLSTIRARHTCSNRVDQLLSICSELALSVPRQAKINSDMEVV